MQLKKPSEPDSIGFQPVDPWKSADLAYSRRNLPHLEVPGATYFVTFRCRRGIQLPSRARDLVMSAIERCDGKSIDLDAAVVMPDHAHAVLRVIAPHRLSGVLLQIKGRSARQVNQLLSQGHRLKPVPPQLVHQNHRLKPVSLWMDESFDHIVRHEAELEEKIEYVRQNPVRRGLVDKPEEYRWLFIKRVTGSGPETTG
jgi:REP element-mobilizing transposase RayT